MLAFQVLFNGHAGAGLGEILIAIAVGALAVTVAIFRSLYRRWPSSWLRVSGLLYLGMIVAHLLMAATIFPSATILLAYLVIFVSFLAGLLWLIALITPRRV